jgi:hypothetical protein
MAIDIDKTLIINQLQVHRTDTFGELGWSLSRSQMIRKPTLDANLTGVEIRVFVTGDQ